MKFMRKHPAPSAVLPLKQNSAELEARPPPKWNMSTLRHPYPPAQQLLGLSAGANGRAGVLRVCLKQCFKMSLSVQSCIIMFETQISILPLIEQPRNFQEPMPGLEQNPPKTKWRGLRRWAWPVWRSRNNFMWNTETVHWGLKHHFPAEFCSPGRGTETYFPFMTSSTASQSWAFRFSLLIVYFELSTMSLKSWTLQRTWVKGVFNKGKWMKTPKMLEDNNQNHIQLSIFYHIWHHFSTKKYSLVSIFCFPSSFLKKISAADHEIHHFWPRNHFHHGDLQRVFTKKSRLYWYSSRSSREVCVTK